MLMAMAIFCLALAADNVFGTTGGKDPHARRLPDVLINPCATKPGKAPADFCLGPSVDLKR